MRNLLLSVILAFVATAASAELTPEKKLIIACANWGLDRSYAELLAIVANPKTDKEKATVKNAVHAIKDSEKPYLAICGN